MDHRDKLKLLLRSRLFYLGVAMFVVGAAMCSDNNAQIPAAILIQGGIIIGFWAYRRTKFIISNPADQALKKRRSRMGLIIGAGMISIGFALTPVVLWLNMAKMSGLLFWYVAATGLVGLLGLVGVFIWIKRSLD